MILEESHIVEMNFLDEGHEFLEILLRFARESDDEIGPDESDRERFFDLINENLDICFVVESAHLLKDVRTDVL